MSIPDCPHDDCTRYKCVNTSIIEYARSGGYELPYHHLQIGYFHTIIAENPGFRKNRKPGYFQWFSGNFIS